MSILEEPWYQFTPPACAKSAAVVGAGIAGCSVAHCLAKAGVAVTLLEQEFSPAMGTSGNRAAVILPVPAMQPNPVSRFHNLGYGEVLDKIEALTAEGYEFRWEPSGVLHLLTKNRLTQIHQTLHHQLADDGTVLALSREQATQVAGLPLSGPALHYPSGGHLDPKRFCQALLNSAQVGIKNFRRIKRIATNGRSWTLFDPDGRVLCEADVLVLANGERLKSIDQTSWFPLKLSRGQLAYLPLENLKKPPKTVLCYQGYMIPHCDGMHLLGATWSYSNVSTTLNDADQGELLDNLSTWVPEAGLIPPNTLLGRVSFRVKSPDHIPLAGPVPVLEDFQRDYEDLHLGQIHRRFPRGTYYPGLFVSSGHGARGLVSAYLAARVITAQITGGQPPLVTDLVQALNPARFLIRELRKHPHHRKRHWPFNW